MVFFIFLSFYHVFPSNSQSFFSPMMHHYSAKDYKAGLSNWDMLQSTDDLLFFSNLSGLLHFDGKEWQYITIKGGKISRAIHRDHNGRIFVGSNDEFGYLDIDNSGNTYYQSLSNNLELKRFGQILQILSIKNDIYFISSKYLIRFNQDVFKYWELKRGVGGFIHQEKLYIKQSNQALLKLNKDSLIALSGPNIEIPVAIRGNTITANDLNEKYIIGIGQKKGFIFRNDSIIETKDQYPFGDLLLSLSKNKDNSYWAATANNGIFNFNIGDSVFNHLDVSKGLASNINFNIYSDKQNGIWAMHQEGITRIQGSKKIMHWGEDLDFDAPISKILNIKNQIYLSTFDGAYTFTKDQSLNLIENSKDRLFSIFHIKDFVLALGDNRLYKFKNSKLINTVPIRMGTNLFLSNANKIYVTTSRNGIIQYSIDSNETKDYLPEITGFCTSILSLGSKHWLSYKSEGVYLIDENEGKPKWKYFNQNHGLPDVNAISILKSVDNEILFTTTKGFYTLNKNPKADSSNLFIPHSSITDEKLNINHIDQDENGNLWLTVVDKSQNQSVIKLQRNKNGSYQKIERSLKVIPNQNFSSVYVDDLEDSIVWIAGNEGLYRFDEKVKLNLDASFNTFIKGVSLNDSILSKGLYTEFRASDSIPTLVIDQPETSVPKIKFSNNNIKFEFSALFYEQPERNKYSYQLQGFDKEWSGWSSMNNKEYTNLPAGKYQFKVKSKNLYDTEGKTAIYKFEILPPWYQTTWAYFIFSIIIVTIIWLLMLAYTYRVRQQRKRLKLIVADRTFEVIQQKKVIEKQLLKMSNLNEEISQQRDDILEKNQELESSQDQIISANNKLQELNQALETRVEKRTAKIKDTIKKLQQTNKDLDTFTYKTSHDLKGPISRIKGILALARFENPESKTDKYLDLIEKTTKEMDILLSKLTQVHNIYNSKVEYNTIDIPTIFKEVMEKISPLVEQSKFKFQFDLKNENELKTDEKMLELILLNLLENALIYADDKKPQQEIKLSTLRKENTFYLSIEDNGVGIAEKQLPRIFEMFYRGSEKSLGNGLGLYLVKVAVEKIGAKLKVETEEFVFTRITIEFPLKG
ncbi:histidine kinase [Marivirga tractuosa DSM 4126]|uniref:histidine kinase n=1 Tax=Marivirga tractuosa (strain ATCC 23168 / DSM 4126 / NBRC 15989 / NCIMB 1408 / VKM B-1430 / H-43) TaxID=643867 RepID=E4TPU2_MARTH|nr:histidine kinase [Marivirga tractuosa DSM 4126]